MAVQPGLCGTWSKTPKNSFLTTRLIVMFLLVQSKKKISAMSRENLLSRSLIRKELVWFGLMLNILVNNFSVMLGLSHCFLGITVYQYFWGVNISCSRTQHGDPSGARTPDLWILGPKCKPPGHRAPNQKGCTLVFFR